MGRQYSNIANIKKYDASNGPGVRVSIFISGCTLKCKGCFNEKEQAFDCGSPLTEAMYEEIHEAVAQPYIDGVSLLGGDPMEPRNQDTTLSLVVRLKRDFPDKTIWLWTGRVIERDLAPLKKDYIYLITEQIFKLVDVVIDGPFMESEKDLTLEWRGSANQRVLNKEQVQDLMEAKHDNTVN